MAAIQLSGEQEDTMEVMLSGESLFLTGKAGAGKSTLIEEFKLRTTGKYITIAPTGKAAINVDGATIHNQMAIPPAPKPFESEPKFLRNFKGAKRDLLQAIDTIIVDEISMVRADVLDAMDQRMRHVRNNNLPFGGVQVILVGDFYQLPPVVTAQDKAIIGDNIFAFQAKSWKDLNPAFSELVEARRQKSGPFLDALNKIRVGDVSGIVEINKYVRKSKKGAVGISFTNAKAAEVNDRMLASLPGRATKYSANVGGKGVPGIPVSPDLALKPGSQVIAAINGPVSKNGVPKFINGSVGVVLSCHDKNVLVQFGNDPEPVKIDPYQWDNVVWTQAEDGSITKESDGKFKQIPLLLAWAMTSHKLQGESLDAGHIDRGNGAFAHGQTYVALSRLRSEEGLSLESPIQARDLIVDPRVHAFMTNMRRLNPTKDRGAEPAIKSEPRQAIDSLSAALDDSINDIPKIKPQPQPKIHETKIPESKESSSVVIARLQNDVTGLKREVASLREEMSVAADLIDRLLTNMAKNAPKVATTTASEPLLRKKRPSRAFS